MEAKIFNLSEKVDKINVWIKFDKMENEMVNDGLQLVKK